MGADTHRPEPIAPPGGLRRIIARDGWAVGAAAAATIGVEVGVYVLALSAGAPRLHAALATLAVATLWTALAAPVLAAEAADGLGAVLRAGIVADASAVALIVLWLSCPQVGLLGAVKIYCILAAMTLPAMAVSRLACGPGGRFALAGREGAGGRREATGRAPQRQMKPWRPPTPTRVTARRCAPGRRRSLMEFVIDLYVEHAAEFEPCGCEAYVSPFAVDALA